MTSEVEVNSLKRHLSLALEENSRQSLKIIELTEQLDRLTPKKKLSGCCNAILDPFISLNKKLCTECKVWYDWNLEHNQPPLFDGGGDKSNFIGETNE